MERIYTLIEKLYQQKQQNASPAHLMFTVQQLQAELARMQQKNGSIGTSKVAVTLPSSQNFADEVVRTAMADISTPVAGSPVVREMPQPQPYVPVKTVEEPQEERQPKEETSPGQLLNPAFDVIDDGNDYSAYLPKKDVPVSRKIEMPEPVTKETQSPLVRRELHEIIAEPNKESLNDRLKEEKTELAHVLTGAPIKDLRKGIGVNDRFTFVHELFRNDNAMYEQSIKTINNFNILSEAEYWINRELKFKLGWNDSNETVQYFYHLIRRRFA